MTLIDNWRKAHRMLTVQAATVLGLVAAAYEYLPAMRDYLPDGWVKFAFFIIIAARLLKQNALHKDDQP